MSDALVQRLQVVVDLFSGRPNPSWELSERQEQELLRHLAELEQQAPAQLVESPGLGYRGLLVSPPRERGLTPRWRLFRGTAQRGTVAWPDPQRRLERWLLATAGDQLDPTIRDLVRADLERGAP
jgi:hypothetical protein